jgi:hypothetical protein
MARRAQALAGALAITIALPVSTSCRQIMGIAPRDVYQADGGSSDAVELMVCGLPSVGPTAACGQCLTEACCDPARLCADAQNCAALEACIRGCATGDAVCRRQCYGATPALRGIHQDLELCRASSCGAECGPGPWACLGNVKWSSRSSIGIAPAITIKTAVDDDMGTPISGATVRVCSMADPRCLLPLATGTTDSAGETALVVDTYQHVPPLAVFLEYHKQGFQDLLMHYNTPPLIQTPPLTPAGGRLNFDGVAVKLQTDGHWSDDQTGTTYDPTRAQVLLVLFDCNGVWTEGVAVTWLDRDEQTKTLEIGSGVVNLPVNPATGITRVLLTEPASGRLVGTANLVVRPDTLSFSALVPTP